MTDDRKAGIALIAGSIGGIVTMAIHPVAGGPLTVPPVERLALVSGIAHSLAMLSILLLFLGACGLTRRIAAADRLAFAAIVTYGFACAAIMIAAAVSGFVVPGIIKQMARDSPAAAHQWQIVVSGIFQINQAFSRIYSVAASLAIILWSVSALRHGGVSQRVALYGCIASPLIILAIVSGHLQLDVHGMAIILLGEVIWFVAAGVQLLTPGKEPLG